MSTEEDRRSFIRHPVEMPIQVYPQASPLLSDVQVRDVGNGGVAFHTNVALIPGTMLILAIPHVQPPFEETCTVCWSQPEADGFEIGVRFLDQQALFKARLVEQVCQIENYRRQEINRGRQLSPEEAASEWVGKYAVEFGSN
ncbi:PilZ domain-containing protein [Mariprofundus ferrooxydans]|uniref:PilZ domain-containing protein n=1 Tax=Mariprofundus ferrooxydans TaxID=314344 RepID=UPI00142F7224|nr:PilZ domain-containing protein [Mariprofundus ferrooxydans]